MENLKRLKTYTIIISFVFSQVSFGQSRKTKINLKEFVLPSEVQKIQKSAGALYYSPSVKGKVLIPVHMWGSVSKSGLHFLPVNTTVINGISMAGGPTGTADLTDVKLMRMVDGNRKVMKYDLSGGGNQDVYKQALKAGDSIYIERSRFYENRSYYTSLIGVFATVLSSILLLREVKK